MKKSRFTEVQIVGVLQEHQKGAEVADLARRHGITETTFYRRTKKHGGLRGRGEALGELRGCKLPAQAPRRPTRR